MSTASATTWQHIYHTTLFKFTREGREQILRDLRESPDLRSATCIYDAHQHHFELSCLAADSENAEKVLVQVIAAFLQDEENKTNEFADYQRKAIKFSHAIVDESNQFSDDTSDNASEPDTGFEGDDLINLSAEPEKTSWTPLNLSTRIEQCFPQNHLDVIGDATGCQLSLDLGNRHISIRPLHLRADASAAKRKLSNIEELTVTEVPALHSLHVHQPLNFTMQLQRLREKGEDDSHFNEDGTLSRLLFPEDSPFLDGLRFDSKGKLLEKLMVLRPYRRELEGDLTPLKSVFPQFKKPTVTPASSAFSRIKFRKLGPEVPTFNVTKAAADVEKAPEQVVVEHWVEDVVNARPKQPVQPAQLKAVNDIEQEQRVRPGGSKPHQRVPHTTFSMHSTGAQRPPNAIKNAAPPPPPSAARAPAIKPAIARPTPKPASQNVFATQTYTQPKTANANANTNTNATATANTWGPKYGPSRAAWGSDRRPENAQPRGISADSFSVFRAQGKPPVSHPRQAPPRGTSSSMRSNVSAKPATKKAPPPPKSLASSNPFAQLGGMDQDEDDEDDDSSADATGDIQEQLAAEDVAPARLRVGRQKAPAPAPAPYFGPGKPPIRNSAATHHRETPTPDTSEPSIGTTDDTSLGSISDYSIHDSLPMHLILRGMKANERQHQLASGSFQNALSKLRSCLERARAKAGNLNIKVQFGKVVIKQAPGEARKDITPNNFESKIKQIPGMSRPDQTFTSAVTTSTSDVDNLLGTLGRVSDSPEVLDEAAFFEFTCIRPDKSSCRVVIDAQETEHEPSVQLGEEMLGVWYNHHPRHAWDSRLLITKHVNVPLENISGASTLVKDLSIRHDPSLMAPNVAGKSDEGLNVQKVKFFTILRWKLVDGVSPKEDVYIEVKRVLDYPIQLLQDPNSAHGQFSALCLVEKSMIDQQRLRFEIGLGLSNPSPKLLQNVPHPYLFDPASRTPHRAEVDQLVEKIGDLDLFEKADWKPEDVLSPEQLLALHEVAAKVVEKMDRVGARNRGFGAPREAELVRQKKRLAESQDQFW